MKKIMMVDDEASLLRLVKANLERTGRFEVLCENKGTNAIESMRKFKPDVVFLDIMMPGMSGDEIATAMQDDPQLRHIPHVFLTAIVTRDETSPTGSDIGGHIFLAKPVKTEEIVATIDKILKT